MQKASLFYVISLLLTATGAVWCQPLEFRSTSNTFKPKELTAAMFVDSTKNMLERHVSVQVLNDRGRDSTRRHLLDSLFELKSNGKISAAALLEALPDSFFETKKRCCNFIWDKRDVYWLRFALENKTDKEDFLVEVVNPFINRIEYYSLNSLKDTGLLTGTNFRFGVRPDSNFRNFLFPAHIAPNSVAWFYLKFESEAPLHLRILIFDRKERVEGGPQQWTVDILMTIFYVFTVLFLILLAILIVASKQSFHWYYFGYVLVTALFIPAHLGLGFMYIWKNNGDLQHIVPMVLNNLRLVLGIQYFRLYFDLPKSSPRLNYFAESFIGVFLLTLFLQAMRFIVWVFNLKFTSEVFILFLGLLGLFSLAMLAWLFREMFLKKRRRFSWLLLVIALNCIGIGITSLQHLGYGSTGFDLADRVLASFRIANTFFLSPFVIGAFFLEMVLVFNFAVRRYLRLIEVNQKTELRMAQAKEQGLSEQLILGIEKERRRIARDLHDSACVQLAAVNMKVDAMREDVSTDHELAQKMTDIADDLDAIYHEVRGISHDLMSKTLDTTGLETALEELTVRIQQAQKGLNVQFYANYPLDRVGNVTKIHLYRIAQELLANVLKHARASMVNLQLLEVEGNLLLTVEDNGQGFDASHNGTDGIGISNVRTRVEALRGKMHLESAPGRGTFVSIEVPRASLVGNFEDG
ncbi:MAG: hypothetical protein KIS77_08845 [Saprospiraceae bacterium]|nr:hypothetical protein [Saprospiraceae bacterium]